MSMDPLEQLVEQLRNRGFIVTPEQAEAMAIRLAGSVEAYLEDMKQAAQEAADYVPLEGEASDKFSEPLGYDLEAPAESGLPDPDQP